MDRLRPRAVTGGSCGCDFNGDDAPDVVWARHDSFHGNQLGNTVDIQLNVGDGTMGDIVEYPAIEGFNDIAAGDLDGDLDTDLVVVVSDGVTLDNTTVDPYLNAGNGTFSHNTTTGGSAATRLALADLDTDGDLDIATTNGWGATFASIVRNNGDGTFDVAQLRYGMHSDLTDLELADMNGDGNLDAVGPTVPTSTAPSQATLQSALAGAALADMPEGAPAARAPKSAILVKAFAAAAPAAAGPRWGPQRWRRV